MTEVCKNNKNNNAIKIIAPLMIAMILAIFGWVFIQINNTNIRVDAYRDDSLEMKGDIKAIRADIGWIKESIENNK